MPKKLETTSKKKPSSKPSTAKSSKGVTRSAVARSTKRSSSRKPTATARSAKSVGTRTSAKKGSPRAVRAVDARGKNLVIVESPAKARTLTGYLGPNFVVQATVGHIWDLPTRKLGVDLQNGFEPEYVVIEGKDEVVESLRKSASGAKQIYVATDPDREGEAIAFHVAQVLNHGSRQLQRVLFNEITRAGVLKAMGAPTEIDTAKVDAQQARRVLDRLVGYMVSPLLQRILTRGLSAGRVQSVALRIICEREEEIRAFNSVEYWTIEALLRTSQGLQFESRLVRIGGKKPEIPDELTAQKVVADVRQYPFVLGDLKARPRSSAPAAPYTTSTLQQDASRRLGFSNDRTMGVAQALYEGVELGSEGAVGLITYMRTDSVRSAPEAVAAVRDFIAERFGAEFAPDKPRAYQSKKAAQDAHEAIRPTDVRRDPASLKKHLTHDQFKLYDLIWKRFVASQMADAKFEVTTATFNAGPYEFQASGRRTLFTGHLQVLTEYVEEKRHETTDVEVESSRELPPLEIGRSYDLEKITPSQHFTEPPPRFNPASLVKTLDELGIGRPSTYASIISVLLKRHYVEQKERRFHPTPLGETVNKLLVEQFPDVFDVKFTARMEEELDTIENDGEDWRKVVKDFYDPFSRRLAKVDENRTDLKQASYEITDKECPTCGAPLVIKWGRSGRFYGCSSYPECRHTEPLETEKPPEVPATSCPNCGKPMAPKRSRYGWFLGCTGYPECKTILPLHSDDSVPCPREGCTGTVSKRRSKRGKTFWGCSNYPECDFISWYKPVMEPCSNCGHHYVEDKPLKSGHIRQCPQCKHKIPLETAPK